MERIHTRLLATHRHLEAHLAGHDPGDEPIYTQVEELAVPLRLCYLALVETSNERLANGKLLDTLRRLACFGFPLVRINLGQESGRHTAALDAITRYLGIGASPTGTKPSAAMYRDWPMFQVTLDLMHRLSCCDVCVRWAMTTVFAMLCSSRSMRLPPACATRAKPSILITLLGTPVALIS